jgi:RNA polymerase sigma-70 factor, ECF subfamily
MRDVLIEQARAESAAVRGGRAVHCPLLEVADDESSVTVDMEAVAKALTELRSADAETADLVEMRFFGGLSLEQIAESMGWSYATTRRTWDYGKSWLAARLKQA